VPSDIFRQFLTVFHGFLLFPPFTAHFRRSPTFSDIFVHFSRICAEAQRKQQICEKMNENVGKCRKMSENVKNCQKLSENVGWYPIGA
jgi:hypothetical protein